MKKNIINQLGILAVVLLATGLVFITNTASAQCEKKAFCDDYEEDFDFRSQSAFAKLSPGDTSSVNVVLYSGQRYRMYVCSDPKLGGVSYQIVNPERKTKRYIVSVKRDTIVIYKTDENGDYMTDDNGNLLVASKSVNIDTTWGTERYTIDKIVFDSKKTGDKPYFEIAPKKSERFIIKITVPAGDPNIGGCVNAYIGRKAVGSTSFSKGGKTRTGQTY